MVEDGVELTCHGDVDGRDVLAQPDEQRGPRQPLADAHAAGRPGTQEVRGRPGRQQIVDAPTATRRL